MQVHVQRNLSGDIIGTLQAVLLHDSIESGFPFECCSAHVPGQWIAPPSRPGLED